MHALLVFFISVLLVIPLGAAISVEVQGVTATQALLYYAAPDEAPCRVEVREAAEESPLVHDVNPLLFSGADLDAERNVLPGGTARLVRVGLRTSSKGADGRWYSRALAAETLHSAVVTCGSDSGTATFTTATPEGIAPEPLPKDPDGFGNLAMPDFDWNDIKKPVIDPRTGVKIYAADPNAWSTSVVVPFSANWYAGGLGWTNPGNVSSYGTAAASTADISPLIVFVDPMQLNNGGFRGGNWPFDNFLDFGVDIWGSGSDGNEANRAIEVALSLDSGQTAYTAWVPLTLGTSNSAAGTIPGSYPKAYFSGWSRILPRNAWPKRGRVTVADGVVTLVKTAEGTALGLSAWEVGSFFLHDWPVGTRIFIANSAPTCHNNLCTIASVQGATRLTLVENLTSGEAEYRSAHLAVMIRKTNSNGSVQISARSRVAVGFHHDIWSGGCSSIPVTTTVRADGTPAGRTIQGYPCVLPKTRQEAGGLYFIGASEPDIRLVSLMRHPTKYGTPLPGHTEADTPIWPAVMLGPTVASFDPEDPTIIYTTLPTMGGSAALFKARYTGDWRTINARYNGEWSNPPISSEVTWVNMTKAADGRDLRSQIRSGSPYDEAKYGSLNSLATVGVSGKYALFTRILGPQDSPCWIFAFDASTGTLVKAWFTADGSGHPDLKYAGCHSVGALAAGAFLISNSGLKFGDARLYGGPFSAPVSAVKRGGAFVAENTSLQWPPSGAYDNACPDDVAVRFRDAGAVEDQCVTVLTKEPCSAVAGPNERSWSPCPWDAEKSMVAPLAEGDFLKDLAGLAGLDSEGFQVVRKTDLGAGNIELVLLRNANYSYCALGKDGVNHAGQFQHAHGWSLTAVSQNQCGSNNMVLDIESNIVTSANYNVTIGHFDVASMGPGIDTWIGSGAGGLYRVMLNRRRSEMLRKADVAVPQWPSFAGYDGGGFPVHANNVQSYVTVKHRAADPAMRAYAFDIRHYNGGYGIDFEYPNQLIGGPTNPVLQDGTSAVYKLTYTGIPDAKRGVLNVWAGEKVLREKSVPEEGDTITDSDSLHFCYAYRDNECRTGSKAGNLFAVIPRPDLKQRCWASQLNQRVPCAFAGPVVATQSIQFRIDQPDPDARAQRFLGNLLMGPNQQYVYSKFLPTPDASYLLFAGFLVNGYHTGLMAMKVPSFRHKDTGQSTFTPVTVKGSGASVYIEFGYEEFGARTDFFCTSRREVCRVSAEEITEANPFRFAHENLTPASGSYTIKIPALQGRILYYRVVDNGEPGPLQAIVP
jgi:hypothetical protein